MDYREKAIEQMAEVLDKLRSAYPRMKLNFTAKTVLEYLSINEKTFSPSHSNLSQRKFKQVFEILKEFKLNLFINWLLNNEDKASKKV